MKEGCDLCQINIIVDYNFRLKRMNSLNEALEHEFNGMAGLKKDLVGIESLLEERPIDHNNIVSSMEQREN